MSRRAACALLSLTWGGVACLPDGPPGDEPLPTTRLEISPAASAGGAPIFVDLAQAFETEEESGWDIGAEGWDLYLNGGDSGGGRAGGIDVDLLDLDLRFEELNRRNQLLYFFFYDAYACAITDWWWYAVDGTHTLFSNYHVYLVRRGERDFAVQVLDYYRVVDGVAEAGYPEFRWVELPSDGSGPQEADVATEDLDATAGGVGTAGDDPANRWTYFSFDDGVLDLDDDGALSSPDWDLGWKRYNVKSNSGASGPGGVTSWDFDADRRETPAEVLDFTPELELSRFLSRAGEWTPGSEGAFEEDRVRPVIQRWVSWPVAEAGALPDLDAERWFLITDRSGQRVYKFRVAGVTGAVGDAAPESLTLEWAELP
jgi:hypothetical protein